MTEKYIITPKGSLIVKKGFLDGIIGIMESIYQAYSKTITYLLLYEKKNRRPL